MGDSLIYSTIKNSLISNDAIEKIGTQNSLLQGDDIASSRTIIDTYLDKTTIKRACCLANSDPQDSQSYIIKVRLPVPKGMSNADLTSVQQKYQYYDKTVRVPKTMCPVGLTPGSDYCNAFYTGYCANITNFYNLENGGNFDALEWNQYKKECSCLGPHQDLKVGPVGQGIPPVCYVTGCTAGQTDVYYDAISRDKTKLSVNPYATVPCTYDICSSNIDFSNNTVGGNTAIQPNVIQNCGGTKASTAPVTPATPALPTPPATNPAAAPTSMTPSSNPPTANPTITSTPAPIIKPSTTPPASTTTASTTPATPVSTTPASTTVSTTATTPASTTATTPASTTPASTAPASTTPAAVAVTVVTGESQPFYLNPYFWLIIMGIIVLLIILYFVFRSDKHKKNSKKTE